MSEICYYVTVEREDGTRHPELRWHTDEECAHLTRDTLVQELVTTVKAIRRDEGILSSSDLEKEFEDFYTERIAQHRQRRTRITQLLSKRTREFGPNRAHTSSPGAYARCMKCEGNAYTCSCSYSARPPYPSTDHQLPRPQLDRIPRDAHTPYTECTRCHKNVMTCGCYSPPSYGRSLWAPGNGPTSALTPVVAAPVPPPPEIDYSQIRVLQPYRGDEKMKFEHRGNEYHIEFERKVLTRPRWDEASHGYIDAPNTHPHTFVRILKVIPEQSLREWPVVLEDSVGCAKGDQFSPSQGRLRALRKIGLTMPRDMRAGMWKAYEGRFAPRPVQGEVVPK